MNKKIGVALFGYGTVGKGVYTLINELDKSYNVKLLKVFDLPDKKDELKDLLETDYNKIITDPSIDIIIECLGGDTLAYKIISQALAHSKSVISSNKETISNHFDEYISLAKANNCAILFEASCGGGIPLLHNVIEISKFDTINSFEGILNGTTNFILSKMFNENMDFDVALRFAMNSGYAEKDPTADLHGLDLVRKGHILASIAFNAKLDSKMIENYGIEHLNNEIIDELRLENQVLKFLVRGTKTDNKVFLNVMPVILKKSNPLTDVNDVFNGVNLYCKNNSLLTFIGKGAGKFPTASAIMQDLMHLIVYQENINRDKAIFYDIENKYPGKYYVFKNHHSNIVQDPTKEILDQYDFVAFINED